MMTNRREIEQDLKEKHTLFAKLVLASYKKHYKEDLDAETLMGAVAVELTKEVILSSTYLAGGCIASQLIGEEVKDYDFFLRDDGTECRTIMRFFGHVPNVKSSANAKTLQLKDGPMLQLINSLKGTPENIVAGFDFRHCQCYFDQGKLFMDSRAMESLLFRELDYTGQAGPSTLMRVARFLNRGWKIQPKTYLKMLQTIEVPEDANGEDGEGYWEEGQPFK